MAEGKRTGGKPEGGEAKDLGRLTARTVADAAGTHWVFDISHEGAEWVEVSYTKAYDVLTFTVGVNDADRMIEAAMRNAAAGGES